VFLFFPSNPRPLRAYAPQLADGVGELILIFCIRTSLWRSKLAPLSYNCSYLDQASSVSWLAINFAELELSKVVYE
jgi:hypothetical protein